MYDFRDKVREIRIKKGLSQKQLVKLTGITQASISQIETKKVMPYGITIKKLSNALDFDFESILPTVMASNHSNLIQIFQEIDKLVQEQEYKEAHKKIITEITDAELVNLGIRKRYNFYLGLINSRGNQEYDIGIFHFLQVLCMQKHSLYVEMIDAETLYEIAVTYQRIGEPEKSGYFYQEALLLVKEIKYLNRENKVKIIEIHYNLACNARQLEREVQAIEVLKKVIALSLDWDCSIFLGQAHLEIAELYSKQKKHEKSQSYLKKAKAIGDAYQNEPLLQRASLLI